MPYAIIHCPDDTYLYGEIVRTAFQTRDAFESRDLQQPVYTVRVEASGRYKDKYWEEDYSGNRFVAAVKTEKVMRRQEIYEYFREDTKPNFIDKVYPPHEVRTIDWVNRHLREESRRLEKMAHERERQGYMDTYQLGTIEKEWDE